MQDGDLTAIGEEGQPGEGEDDETSCEPLFPELLGVPALSEKPVWALPISDEQSESLLL